MRFVVSRTGGTQLRSRLRGKCATVLGLLVAMVVLLESGCRAEQSWPLWQHYRAHFLDGSGRIIDHSAGDKTTSEGQAYGMFFALVANDRKSFDSMLQWTTDNLASGDLTAHLPAWSWGRTDTGEWKQIDTNSAADADLWLAYDCLEAGRLWHDDRLSKLGAVLADRISHNDVALVPSLGTVVLPGPRGFHPAADAWILNPSYVPPQVIARMRLQAPDGPWESVQESLSTILTKATAGGFAMDWVTTGATGLRPLSSPQVLTLGKPGTPAVGAYEAIRVYLWLGLADRETPAVRDGLAALPGMAAYLSKSTTPPQTVDADGNVNDPNSPVGFSAAVYPYLLALSQKQEAAAQMDRVDASLDPTTGLYGRSGLYYDQNLVMFAQGWKNGLFRFDRDGRLRLKWK